jgi:hypothetical protein
MAAIIKRENMGSGRPDTFRMPAQEFKGGVPFNVLGHHIQKAKDEAAKKRTETYEGNAEMQRRRYQMTPEERSREAIERMIPTAKVVESNRLGREATTEEARKKAESIAYKADRMKGGE